MQEVVLSASSDDDCINLWDLKTATTLVSYKPSSSSTFASLDFIGRDYFAISQAAKPALQIFSWKKDQPYMRCPLPEKLVSMACSPSGGYIFGGGGNGRLFLWEAASGAMLRTWEAHYRSVSCIVFSDDGSHAISCSEDSLIHVWSLGALLDYGEGHMEIPQPAVTWNQHSLPVTSLVMGAGGAAARLFSASLDRTVRQWHVPSGACLAVVQMPSPITCLALHPADHLLCAGGSDGLIHSLDLLAPLPSATGAPALAPAQKYAGHAAAVLCLAMSVDGCTLVSGSRDGTARVWDVPRYPSLRTPPSNPLEPQFPIAPTPSSQPVGLF
jgi:pre-rRNA-processing protein IPI3